MASVKEHYNQVLAEVYSWMHGGFAAAIQSNCSEIDFSVISAPVPAVPHGRRVKAGIHNFPEFNGFRIKCGMTRLISEQL
jgi:hypothetical protein